MNFMNFLNIEYIEVNCCCIFSLNVSTDYYILSGQETPKTG